MTEKFHFEISNSEPTPERTIADLPESLLSAMGRKAGGLSIAEQLANHHSLENLAIAPEVREWAEQRLFRATQKWQKYNGKLTHKMPDSGEEMLELMPDLATKLEYFHATASANIYSNYNTEFLLVPYADMHENIDDLSSWLEKLRKTSGKKKDEIPKYITDRLASNDLNLYIDIPTGEPMPLRDYLEMQVNEGRKWGMHLIRAAQPMPVGLTVARQVNPFAKEAKFDFASYGIAEWIADTLQNQSQDDRKMLMPASVIDTGTNHLALYGRYETSNDRYIISSTSESGNPHVGAYIIPMRNGNFPNA